VSVDAASGQVGARAVPAGADRQRTERRRRPTGPAEPALAAAATGGGIRLLRGLRVDGAPMSLADHLHTHGQLPRSGADLVAVASASGLLGRGGAGFPLGTKMSAARQAASRRRPPLVVVNAAESEPASRKDFLLVTRAPHLVLDGAAAAAAAIGASEAVVWVHRGRPAMADALAAAIAERAGGNGDPSFRVQAGPDRYVSGQATAAVAHLAGGPALPSTTAVPMARRGLGGRPTLVSNAETLAHLALIVRYGADAFRASGTAAEPGTMLVTVTGAVTSPGVVEAEVGTPIHRLLAAAGGLTAAGLGAVLVGGYAGSWLAPERTDLPYSRAGLALAGADPGACLVVALPSGACPVRETAHLTAWLADQSAGQCGPCRNGLPALAAASALLADAGPGAGDAPAALRRWAGMVDGRGACHHPDGVVRLVRSMLLTFGADVAAHAAGAGCPPAAPGIAVPAAVVGPWR